MRWSSFYEKPRVPLEVELESEPVCGSPTGQCPEPGFSYHLSSGFLDLLLFPFFLAFLLVLKTHESSYSFTLGASHSVTVLGSHCYRNKLPQSGLKQCTYIVSLGQESGHGLVRPSSWGLTTLQSRC